MSVAAPHRKGSSPVQGRHVASRHARLMLDRPSLILALTKLRVLICKRSDYENPGFHTSLMKRPSRQMPAAPPHAIPWWRWPILAPMLGVLAYWTYCHPYLLLFPILIGMLAFHP